MGGIKFPFYTEIAAQGLKLNITEISYNKISLFLEEFMCYHIDGMSQVRSTAILHKILN